jgi:hypothetical protein
LKADPPSHHVFISFSSKDQAKADSICTELEKAGMRCWISSRDVDPGTNYQASIVQAIQSARVMVLIFSQNTNLSQEVHKEMSLASSFGLVVVPLRIAEVKPSGALLYELATRQWIDAFVDWETAMARLVAKARLALSGGGEASPASVAGGVSARTEPSEIEPRVPLNEPQVSAARVQLSQDDLDSARKALAFYVGPIAELLVRKTSAKASSIGDFHDRLAAHIQSADGQKAFRQRLRG